MEFTTLFNETLERIGFGEAGIAVGRIKGEILIRLVEYSRLLRGDIAEVGVYTGGSARMIAKTAPEKVCRVFDTFEGMADVFDKDLDGANFEKEFSGIDGLFELACRTMADCKNIQVWRGLFPDTAHELGSTSYCFVHADADVYKSTMDICEFFYPRLVVGGIILFDDYGYAGAPGAKKAVDEYFRNKPEAPSVLSTGQAVVIKTYE